MISKSNSEFFSQFNTTSVQDWELEFRVSRNSDSQSEYPSTFLEIKINLNSSSAMDLRDNVDGHGCIPFHFVKAAA